MLLKSDTVHNAWAATQRTVDVRLTINGTEYGAADVTSLTFDSGAMNGETITLGSTYQNTIKVVFSHLIEGLKLTDEIAPELGIKLPDGAWDYTPLGVFVIDTQVTQDRNNNTTTVSASDRMCMMGGTYTSKLTYPAAVNEIAVEIANLAAVKINESDFARLPTDKVATFGKVTYRDAIGYVAQFAGGFATFDRDGLLDIRQLVDPSFSISPDQYQSKGLTKNEALYRIGGIACSVTTTTKDSSGSETQETTTLQSGSTAGTQISISNPGMTQDLLDGLYEQLQDLNFYPFSLAWFGDPNLESGDWISVQDTAGNEFKTPNLLYTLTFSGGVTATSKADTTVTASANFVYKGSLNQVVKNIRQYLNAAGHAVSEGIDEPAFPKAGDIWFKKDGPDTDIMIYKVDPETGIGTWVEEVSTKGITGLDAELKKAKEQLDADIAAAKADLAIAKQDVAALQTKLATNEATQAQLTTDLAANAKLVTQNKVDVDAALVTVNTTLEQATADTAAAVKQADDAVTQAQQAVVGSDLATKTAQAASDAASAAKAQAVATATDFVTVQSQATSAAGDAKTALDQARQALATASTAQAGMQPAISAAVDTVKGELTASIQTVQSGLDNLSIGGTNLLPDSLTMQSWVWEADTSTHILLNADPSLPFSGAKMQQLSAYPWDSMSPAASAVSLINGKRYVYSAYVRGAVSGTASVEAYYSAGGTQNNAQVITIENVALTTIWRRVSYTFTSTVDGPVTIRFECGDYGPIGGSLFVALEKLEVGNVATDWSPSPEDVQRQITTNTLNITANSKVIAVAAKQETVDQLTQQVNTNTAQLKLTATEAELKLATQSVDALTGRVTNAEGTIKATSDALTRVYTKAETDGLLTPYATQTWTQGQVTTAANQWSVDLASVQTKIDNLQVGGTNLLPDALTMASWKIDDAGNGEIVDAGSELGVSGAMALHMYGKAWASFSPDYTKVCLTKGEKYTYSAYVKSESAGSASLEAYYSAGDTQFGAQLVSVKMESLTPNWQRFGYTFTSTVDGPVTIRFECGDYGPIGSMFVALEKLERGTVMTDWSPAPADAAVYTDTAVASLKLTVDGLSGTFAKQSDLASATTNLKVTSDGLNLLTAVTGVKGEKITQVIADVNTLETQMTGPDGATARLQTLEGFQQTATGNISNLQSQQTTLAGQWTSTVSKLDSLCVGGTNLLAGTSEAPIQLNSWMFSRPAITIGKTIRSGDSITYRAYLDNTRVSEPRGNANVALIGLDKNGNQTFKVAGDTVEGKAEGYSSATALIDDKTVTVTPYIYTNNMSDNTCAGREKLEIGTVATDWSPSPYDLATGTQITQLQNQIDLRATVSGKITAALNLSADGGGTALLAANHVHITGATTIDNAAIQSAAIASLDAGKITTGSLAAGILATTKLNANNITSGSISAGLLAATAISATNITSGTLDASKLTVKNISADSIASGSIAAARLAATQLSATNITAGTFDASKLTVKNLSASSITGGTINGATVNVIGLNASAISAGIISGANLAINLGTGQVTFQKGRVHSTSNNIDINVDSGYISTADANTRVMLKGGEMQFVEPSLFSLSATPYLSISNIGGSTALAGASFVGRDTAVLTNSANSADWVPGYGKMGFSGISTGKNNNSNWGPTIVGGAERGIVLSGGAVTTFNGAGADASPYIAIGSKGGLSDTGGNRIAIWGEYVHIQSTYFHTASGSANVIVKPDGALVRTSSATKYKSNIDRFTSTDMAERLLTLPAAHWYNKGDLQRYADDPQHNEAPLRDYGMIAEDLAAAGLEDLVVRGADGELEDIRYDRIAVALLPLVAQMQEEIKTLKDAANVA